MTPVTKTLMRRLRIKLTKLIRAECRNCGFPEQVDEAIRLRIELEFWLEDEIEQLQKVEQVGIGGQE